MPRLRSLYRLSSGEIEGGVGPFDPSIPQIPNPSPTPEQPTIDDPDFAIMDFGDVPGGSVVPRLHKIVNGLKVDKTSAEVDAYDAAKLADESERESLRPGVLAMVGLVVRQSDVPAWSAMTNAQKKSAVRNAAGVYKKMREFFDKGA